MSIIGEPKSDLQAHDSGEEEIALWICLTYLIVTVGFVLARSANLGTTFGIRYFAVFGSALVLAIALRLIQRRLSS